MKYILACFLTFFINITPFASTITVGTLDYDPPFEMRADKNGNFFGFDIDLMNEICKRLRATCKYKAVTFSKLLEQTLSGKIDIAIAAITITPERQATWMFSLPYLASKAGLLTKSGASIKYTSELGGKHIGIETGTLFKTLIEQQFPDAKIEEFDTQSNLLQAISSDNVDVVILDYASAVYWVNNNGSSFKLIGDAIPIGIGYGIMASPAQTPLINRINQVMTDMQNDGTWQAIYERYF